MNALRTHLLKTVKTHLMTRNRGGTLLR